MTAIEINPQKEPLTTENLRTFEGFENLNSEEANLIVYTIHELCDIIYEYLKLIKSNESINFQKIAA